MKDKRPERLEDVEITPEAWQMFEHAVDRATAAPRPPKAAKKAAKAPVAKLQKRGAKAS